MKKQLTSSQQFVQRLELLDSMDAEIPSDSAEAERILREAGIDPKSLVERARKHVHDVRGRLARSRLAQAAGERKSEKDRLAARVKSYASLTMEQLSERVRLLGASPQGQGLAVAHKGLTGPSSREELEALLAEYEYLENEAKNVKD